MGKNNEFSENTSIIPMGLEYQSSWLMCLYGDWDGVLPSILGIKAYIFFLRFEIISPLTFWTRRAGGQKPEAELECVFAGAGDENRWGWGGDGERFEISRVDEFFKNALLE
jgi:hypothetical protein